MPGVVTVHRGVRYASTDGLAAGLVPVLHDAMADDTAVTVALDPPTAAAVRDGLGREADAVEWLDATRPARSDAFQLAADRARAVVSVAERGGRSLFVGQNQPALGLADAYWLRLEAALEIACAGLPVTLLCPYRTGAGAGEPPALRRLHAEVTGEDLGESVANPAWDDPGTVVASLPDPLLPDLGDPDLHLEFDRATLREARRRLGGLSTTAGLDREACEDLVYAANEIVTNGVEHGAGSGRLRAWVLPGSVVCEVADAGRLGLAFPGVRPPASGQARGRGLWLARALCADVVVARDGDGTRVRLAAARP